MILTNGSRLRKLIHWYLPDAGEVKLNTAGCWYDFTGASGLEESLEIVKAFGFLATMGKHQAALL